MNYFYSIYIIFIGLYLAHLQFFVQVFHFRSALLKILNIICNSCFLFLCISTNLLNSVKTYLINDYVIISLLQQYWHGFVISSVCKCVSGPQRVGAAAEHSRFGSGQRTWGFVPVQTGELDGSEETSAHHDLLGDRVRVLPPNPVRQVLDSCSLTHTTRVHISHAPLSITDCISKHSGVKHSPIMHLSINAKHKELAQICETLTCVQQE